MINFTDYNHIVIEFLCDHYDQNINSIQRNITYLPNTGFYWPLAKVDFNCQDLQVGDIVDVKVKLCLSIFYACTKTSLLDYDLRDQFNHRK